MTAQTHSEPTDTTKPTTEHCTAIQREEIQVCQPEHRHKLPQPGKGHRTLTQPRPQGHTLQPRATALRTFFTLFFLSLSLSLSLSFFPFI